MRGLPRAVLLLLLTAAALRADPAPPGSDAPSAVPAASVIHLPEVPAPVPPPAPGARVRLAGLAVYDFRTTAPCVVRAYPAGLVSITSEAVGAGETLRIRDAFFDGAKSRTYKGPCTVYFVRAAGTGPCELVITPLGLKLESDLRTVALDVDAGQGPIPPPKPVPPGPEPKPPGPPAPKGFRVIFVYETSAVQTPAMQQVMFGEKVRNYLDAKTVAGAGGKGWRRYDKDVDASNERDAAIRALWTTSKPLLPNPFQACVIVTVDERAEILPFPANEDAALLLFAKYFGG